MHYLMSSWKKTGGINYNSKFNTVRVQNSVSGSSSFVGDIGEKNTATNVNSDLRFKEDASLYSTESILDDRSLVAFYRFTDISGLNSDTIENSATFNYGNQYTDFDHSIMNLKITDLVNATDPPTNNALTEVGPTKTIQVENIEVPPALLTEKSNFIHFNEFIRFEGRTCTDISAPLLRFTDTPCKSLISETPINFNNYSTDDRVRGGNLNTEDVDMSSTSGTYNHHNSLTVMSWIRINKYDTGNSTSRNPPGFLLFSLDDSVDGDPDSKNERLCFWAPGVETGGTPQVHFGGRPKTGTGSNIDSREETSDINVKTGIQIPYNKWTLVALVINGNRAYIYQEANNPRGMILSQEIFLGDYRVPEKNIIVNGSRFYNISDPINPGWIQNNSVTSTLSMDVVDMKVYKTPLDFHTIHRIYEHDNPFYNEKVNFRLDNNFTKIGEDLIVGKDAYIQNDLVVSNNLKSMGVLEIYNNSFVAGSLGVGIQEFNSDYRLNVLGNLRSSGNLYLGDGDQDNSIFFKVQGVWVMFVSPFVWTHR